jgi:hypothetical protein
MKTTHKEYLVDKSMIGFIKFIFEGHEGLAISTTLDAAKGHIRLAIAPERIKTAQMIITDLQKGFKFNEI